MILAIQSELRLGILAVQGSKKEKEETEKEKVRFLGKCVDCIEGEEGDFVVKDIGSPRISNVSHDLDGSYSYDEIFGKVERVVSEFANHRNSVSLLLYVFRQHPESYRKRADDKLRACVCVWARAPNACVLSLFKKSQDSAVLQVPRISLFKCSWDKGCNFDCKIGGQTFLIFYSQERQV
ncbi:hypothetical protein IMY05_015G0124500 [Salix suchowensis]|nr:hypothetical protein IMY05_015G0124500 [Salix suchowensis]